MRRFSTVSLLAALSLLVIPMQGLSVGAAGAVESSMISGTGVTENGHFFPWFVEISSNNWVTVTIDPVTVTHDESMGSIRFTSGLMEWAEPKHAGFTCSNCLGHIWFQAHYDSSYGYPEGTVSLHFDSSVDSITVFGTDISLTERQKTGQSETRFIEPELVKSEDWTQYYYIDQNSLDLEPGWYPYLQCRADVYSDGTIEASEWNTQAWESYRYDPDVTVKIPTLLANSSIDWTDRGITFNDKQRSTYYDEETGGYTWEITPTQQILSWIRSGVTDPVSTLNWFLDSEEQLPVTATYQECSCALTSSDHVLPEWVSNIGDYIVANEYTRFVYSDKSSCSDELHLSAKAVYLPDTGTLTSLNIDDSIVGSIHCEGLDFTGKLGAMPVGISQPIQHLTLYPKSYPKEKTSITLAGHELVIDPEELIPRDPVTRSWEEVYLAQCEAEITTLKTQVASYSAFDSDSNGLITAVDAQNMLEYYLESLVGNTSGTVEDYRSYLENREIEEAEK